MERHALGEQIRANNRRLRDLQDQLCNQKLEEEIIRTRGEIYASVIHDINGPLTIISGFIDIINRHVTGSTSLEGGSLELVKDRLSRVTRQVNNCIDISQRYLGFLRKKPADRLAVALPQVLSDLRELLHVHASMQKNKLQVELPADDLQVRVNGAELIQILLNLTINALQCSSDPHQVTVSAARVEKPLDLAALVDGEESRLLNREGLDTSTPLVALVVEDDGPGIRSDILPRLFQAGFSTKAIDDKGTGYGLSVVHRLVASYKGAIHVQTRVGSGTRFTLYLPAVG
jgi:signal transduction histidine kinase